MATKATTAKTNTKAKTVPAAASRANGVNIPESYTPISMWGYFGYTILFAIPIVGFICCICFAIFAHNQNLKNFARSQFCWLIICILAVIFLASAGFLQIIAKGILSA